MAFNSGQKWPKAHLGSLEGFIQQFALTTLSCVFKASHSWDTDMAFIFSASMSSIQLVQISPVPYVHSCTRSSWEKCSIHRSRCDKRPFDKVDIFVICCHCFRRNSQKFARNVFSQWDDILALLVTSWRGRTWVWLFVWCMFRNLRHLTVFKVWTATRSSKDPFMTFSSSSSVFP